MRAAAIRLLLLAVTTAPTMGQVQLEFRSNEALAMHWWVRAQAGLRPELRIEASGDALTALIALEAKADDQSDRFLLFFETMLAQGAPLPRAAEIAQQRTATDKGVTQTYLKALIDLTPWYQANRNALTPPDIAHHAQLLTEDLRSLWPAALAHAAQNLGMKPPARTIPIVLVPTGPHPGAITFRTKSGPICLVALDCGADCGGGGFDLLVETVVHEALHALDVITSDQDTALMLLRNALAEADDLQDYRRSAPHTLIFAQAGHTVHHWWSPDYRTYGDVCQVYRQEPGISKAIREAWYTRLRDDLPLPEAVEKVLVGMRATIAEAKAEADRRAALQEEANRQAASQPTESEAE